MKNLFIYLFLLNISFIAFAQEDEIMDAADDMSANESAFENKIDTLQIKSGKPVIFLINIDEYGVQSFTDSKELSELQNNLGEKLRVENITGHTIIILENNQKLDFSDGYQSFVKTIFWSGKNQDNYVETDLSFNLTEFAANQMGLNKQSSYNINAKKYKAEIAELLSKNNYTEASKAVMNKFLNVYTTQLFDDSVTEWFKINNKDVKSITVSSIGEQGTPKNIGQINFNESGQITELKSFGRNSNENKLVFNYKNGMLDNITNADSKIDVFYNNNEIILKKSVGDADQITVLSLVNNKLLSKSYTLMLNDDYAHMNVFSDTNIDGNCAITSINNVIWKKECSTEIEKFPFVHEYTSYQDGEILQYRKYKIEKINNSLFEKSFSNTDTPEEKDNYQLAQKFELNEKGQISKVTRLKNKKNTVINLTYQYFEE